MSAPWPPTRVAAIILPLCMGSATVQRCRDQRAIENILADAYGPATEPGAA